MTDTPPPTPPLPEPGPAAAASFPPPVDRLASTPLGAITSPPYTPPATPVMGAAASPKQRVGAAALWTWLPIPIYTLLVGNPLTARALLRSAGPERFRLAGIALFPKWGGGTGDRSGRDIFDGIVKAFWTDSQGGLAARNGRSLTEIDALPMWCRVLALLALSYLLIRASWRTGRATFLGVWGATTVAAALAGGVGNLVFSAAADRVSPFDGPLSMAVDGVGYGAQFGLGVGLITALIATVRSSSETM